MIKYSNHSYAYSLIFPGSPSPPKKSKDLFASLSMKNLRNSTCIVRRAQNIPTFPMSEPIASNFSCNGVVSTFYSSLARILPTQLFLPTIMQTNHPSPVANCVPDKITGDGRSCGLPFLLSPFTV